MLCSSPELALGVTVVVVLFWSLCNTSFSLLRLLSAAWMLALYLDIFSFVERT